MEKSEKAKQLRALRKYGKKVGRTTDGWGQGCLSIDCLVWVGSVPGVCSIVCLLSHSSVGC